MAQASLTLTAVDKTQAAINSALRGMKTVERTAKVTARAVNLAFGFLTGTAIISAFGKITDAAKKTAEGRRALEDLNKALKDPALVAAANTFTTALVNGFTNVIEATTVVIKQARELGQTLGLISPTVQIDRSQLSGKGPAGRGGVSGRVGGLGTRGPDEVTRMIAQYNASIQADMRATVAREKAAKEAQRLAEEINNLQSLTMTSMEKTVSDFLTFESAIDRLLSLGVITRDQASMRMMDQLNEILPEVEVTGKRVIPEFKKTTDQMTVFAEAAAQNIQTAFANFLFDPFENGLRGMLSGFMNVIRRMIAEVAAQEILLAIFSPFKGSSGFLGKLYSNISAKAMGGPVSGGKPYIVGERGPELFVPGTSGGIVPNNRLAMGGGVTVAPVYNIDARGATADLQAALPAILSENNRRIFDELDRRYGIGR